MKKSLGTRRVSNLGKSVCPTVTGIHALEGQTYHIQVWGFFTFLAILAYCEAAGQLKKNGPNFDTLIYSEHIEVEKSL